MAITKAQQKAVAKYTKNNYDEIKVRVAKGAKDVIQSAAAAQGETINGYIKAAIKAKFTADTGKDIDL